MSFLSFPPRNTSDVDLETDLSAQTEGYDLESKPVEVQSKVLAFTQPKTPNLSNALPLRPLQWHSYLRPLWWVSLGLHLLLLRVPLPTKSTPTPPKTGKSVKITRIAPSNVKPDPSSKPKLVVKPKPITQKVSALPVPNFNRVVSPTPVQPAPTAQVSPSIPTSTPQPEKPTLPASLLETELKRLLTFPQAEPACGGKCYEINKNLDAVAAQFFDKLSAQKWEPKLISSQNSAQKIYRIEKQGLLRFLNILTRPSGIVVYALADQEISLEDLNKAEESIPAISDILGSIKGLQSVDASYTAQPKLFERPDSDIESINWLEGVKPDDVWKTYLENEIKNGGFNFSISPKPYGGGPIYVITRPLFIGYLNLVPSEDGNGTVIFLWKVSPH